MRSRTVGTAALLGVAAFVLYVSTLSRQPSADSVFFALAIESGDPFRLVNLRHPLLHPLGWAFVELWRVLGWQGRALLPLQVLNALGGAAAVALVHHIAMRLTASLAIATAVAAGFAVSGAVWLLSTEAEFVTVPFAAGLLVLDALLAARSQDWERPAFLAAIGAAVGAATLCYLSNASLGAVAIAAAYPGTAAPPRGWARRAALLIAGALLVIVPAIAVHAQLDVAHAQLRSMLVQTPGYFPPSWFVLPHAAYAFVRSLLLYPDLGMNDSTAAYLAAATSAQRAAFATYYAFAGALALTVPLLAIRRRGALRRAYRRPALLLALWALLHAAFALVWVVGDCSFWVPVLAAWWLLVALLLATAPAPRRARKAVALAAAVLLVANGFLFILPRHDLLRNRRHWIAAGVAEHTAPNDIIVTRNNDLLVPYLRYFAQRPVIDAAPADVDRAAATALERAQASGGRVFVVGLSPPERFTVVRRSDVAGEPMWQLQPLEGAAPSAPGAGRSG
jgi:hypothetical protein